MAIIKFLPLSLCRGWRYACVGWPVLAQHRTNLFWALSEWIIVETSEQFGWFCLERITLLLVSLHAAEDAVMPRVFLRGSGRAYVSAYA